MEVYLKLLDVRHRIERIPVSTGAVNGRIVVQEVDEPTEEPQIETGTAYAEKYKEIEEKRYENHQNNQNNTGTLSCIDTIFIEEEDIRRKNVESIYQSGFFFTNQNRLKDLSIYSIKDDFLKILQSNQVVIVRGHTGCGKTTQIPQFILDECKLKNEYCNIVVTQPRKIAAISIAQRVCSERGWTLGTICGYQIGLDRQVCQNTLITYATTGVLLQKIISSKNLNEFTHIIIDEVHERTQETDFLLLIIKRYLHINSPNTKVILMSATFDTDTFGYYFKTYRSGTKYPAPTICVNQASNFDTQIYYIEDFVNFPSKFEIPRYELEEPKIHDSLYLLALNLIEKFDAFDKDDSTGQVLVFLPGIFEIESLHAILDAANEERPSKNKERWTLVPLHSSIPSHEQARVFVDSGRSRKIILSTNIAESSITVPDVVYVIDFCLTKSMCVNKDTQYQSLELHWAAETNCKQRAGRVGRVRPGKVYRLVPKSFYKRQMPKETVPEILQAPLDRIVLCAKKLELDEPPRSILALAINPPPLESIDSTILNLKECGAMMLTYKGMLMGMDGDLTFLGHIMAALPLDVKLSKLICLGYIFSCLDECIDIAAGCSLSNIFSTPFRTRINAYANKLAWADGSFSDLLAHYSLYKVWEKNMCHREYSTVKERKKWCQQNYLSYRSMNEWTTLSTEIRNRLKHMGIVAPQGPERVDLNTTELSLMLKVVISGAFYPNYFTRSCDGGQVDERETVRTLKGLNPLNTVYFKNMDPAQPGPLYLQRIKEIMAPVSENIQVSFDSTSSVYVSFNDVVEPMQREIYGRPYLVSNPTKISKNVYKAIKMRQLKLNTSFPVLSPDESWELAKAGGYFKDAGGRCTLKKTEPKVHESVIPSMGVHEMKILVTHAIDAGHFYAQPSNAKCSESLQTIQKILNNKNKPLPRLNPTDLKVGTICASMFENEMYRCKIQYLSPVAKNKVMAQILYIDYGNTEVKPPENLYEINNDTALDLPPQAMECVLTGIQPLICLNPHFIWSERANRYFESLVDEQICTAKIYSVVHDVVSVDLSCNKSNSRSINELLIKMKHAEVREESFYSKDNHMARQQYKIKLEVSPGVLQITGDAPKFSEDGLEAPKEAVCRSEIYLKGPFSPLEMKVYGIDSGQHAVTIDPNSVNAVLLDTDPQDPHTRLLVAAYVSQKQNSAHLTLRHTTLMPNIHGYAALMALMFAPKILTKTNDSGTRYTSLLCGLGANPKNGIPIYHAHDISITLDTEITKETIKITNEIRYCMNKIVDDMESMSNKEQRLQTSSYHRDLKDRVIQLLQATKVSCPRENTRYAHSWTKSIYQGQQLVPSESSRIDNVVWHLHHIIELVDSDLLKIQLHLQTLKDYASKVLDMEGPVCCKICHLELRTLGDLRVHLVSDKHKQNVSKVMKTQAH